MQDPWHRADVSDSWQSPEGAQQDLLAKLRGDPSLPWAQDGCGRWTHGPRGSHERTRRDAGLRPTGSGRRHGRCPSLPRAWNSGPASQRTHGPYGGHGGSHAWQRRARGFGCRARSCPGRNSPTARYKLNQKVHFVTFQIVTIKLLYGPNFTYSNRLKHFL